MPSTRWGPPCSVDARPEPGRGLSPPTSPRPGHRSGGAPSSRPSSLRLGEAPMHQIPSRSAFPQVGGDLRLVGLTGFEPAASSSRTRRATKLRHSPPLPAWREARGTLPERRGDNESGMVDAWHSALPRARAGDLPAGAGSQARGHLVSRGSGRRHQVHQRGFWPTGQPHPDVGIGAHPGRDVQPGRSRVTGRGVGGVPVQGPLARAGSRSQLVASAPTPGRQICPPWVCPAITAS